jgi:hypothetical protein
MSRRRVIGRREFLQWATLAAGAAGLDHLPALAAAPAAPNAPEKLGARLVGKLEGATLVLDPANFPKKFSEAPMLAE